jgi:hypothetical protein
MDNAHRWLEDNPALLMRDWLPPEDEWPELAELRTEHERLLDARTEAWEAAGELTGRFSAEDEARSEEMKVALREGREPDEVPVTSGEQRADESREAIALWDSATEVLVEFLQEATDEIADRAPELYAQLGQEEREAEAKREEARRMLAEADRRVAGITRKRHWLDRGSGASKLGHYPYEQMPIPEAPAPTDLESVLAGGAITEVTY